MNERESTHDVAQKTERGEPVTSPDPTPPSPAPDGGIADQPGEGPSRQVKPDGR